ncbi:MAG: L-glyceraldehyde 3-phosphate reductase [Bacteroidales bacterium]|nr:L-glyceraldehyde 3-phosphate reductase [Bacteroidales bacterium]
MVDDIYKASEDRYTKGVMEYRRSGNSGIKLPLLSLGFWWNFGGVDSLEESRAKMRYAFDQGVTCFDLANNYGPPFGSAEETFGYVYSRDLKPYRHEMIVTTKAGYNMWNGPYGVGSSRKMIITSLEESLKRMNLDYVDIYYSHRYDGETPVEETMQALVDVVRQGKALYVGLSNYPVDVLAKAVAYLKSEKVHPLIYQGKYNMMVRDVEVAHFDFLQKEGVGFTAFSPIAQGVLSDKYLKGVPADSRVGRGRYLTNANVTPDILAKVSKLNDIALQRGQSLAQMAMAWILSHSEVTSVIIGPRTVDQLKDSLGCRSNTHFSDEEIANIDSILK